MPDTDELYYDAVDLLRLLISIPSISRSETEAADAVERFMQEHGMNPSRSGNNVWVAAPGFDRHCETGRRVDPRPVHP